MNISSNPKTNWKYILIVAVFAMILEGGILGWSHFHIKKELAVKTDELRNKSKTIESLVKRVESLQKEVSLLRETAEFEVEEPKPEITDWKIYRNEKYGFEFRYPKEYDDYEECKIRESKDMITIGDPGLARFIIEIKDSEELNPLEYAIKEIVKVKVKPSWVQDWSISYPYWIGKELGVKVWERTGPRYAMYFYLQKNNKIYRIIFASGPSCLEPGNFTIPSELDIFEQIPFTFNFLQ